MAFEVIDAWQGRGVGRLLLTAIAERAAQVGISRVRALVLTENTAAMRTAAGRVPGLPGPTRRRGDRAGLPAGRRHRWEITMDDILADLAA